MYEWAYKLAGLSLENAVIVNCECLIKTFPFPDRRMDTFQESSNLRIWHWNPMKVCSLMDYSFYVMPVFRLVVALLLCLLLHTTLSPKYTVHTYIRLLRYCGVSTYNAEYQTYSPASIQPRLGGLCANTKIKTCLCKRNEYSANFDRTSICMVHIEKSYQYFVHFEPWIIYVYICCHKFAVLNWMWTFLSVVLGTKVHLVSFNCLTASATRTKLFRN